MRASIVGTAAIAALVLCAACNVYDPSLLRRADGGGPDGSSQVGEQCELARPPLRPELVDDGEEADEFVYALRDVVLDQRGGRWESIGLDLDGLCSQPPDPKVECVPPDRESSPEIDGEGGIDNSFGHNLFPLIQLVLPNLEEIAQMNQREGTGAVLLWIRGWNGEDEDPRVDVSLSQTVFGTPAEADGSAPEVVIEGSEVRLPDGGSPPPPAWDGTDYWWARSETFVNGDPRRPRVRDDNAYVAKGELVMALPERIDIVFSAEEQGVLVRLTDARATATFSADRTRLERVVVGGRWSILDLLETARAVGVCENTTEYGLLLSQIEAVADVRSRRGTGGPGVSCDAVSTGVEMVGFQGFFGGLMDPPELPNACAGADAGTPDAGAGPGADGG